MSQAVDKTRRHAANLGDDFGTDTIAGQEQQTGHRPSSYRALEGDIVDRRLRRATSETRRILAPDFEPADQPRFADPLQTGLAGALVACMPRFDPLAAAILSRRPPR